MSNSNTGINKRIREIRKFYHLTQTELGQRMGISNTAVSKLESGENNVSEKNIMVLHNILNINEDWLRTGQGHMLDNIPQEDEYFKAATMLSKNNDELAMRTVIEYWKLDDKSKKAVWDFLERLMKNH